MRRLLAMPMTLGFAGAMLVSGVARAQGTPRGFWTVPDATAAHSGWQKAETQITTETVGKNFKLLWKLKLGNGSAKGSSFSEPILFPGLITGQGLQRPRALGGCKHLVWCRFRVGRIGLAEGLQNRAPGMWRFEYSSRRRSATADSFWWTTAGHSSSRSPSSARGTVGSF